MYHLFTKKAYGSTPKEYFIRNTTTNESSGWHSLDKVFNYIDKYDGQFFKSSSNPQDFIDYLKQPSNRPEWEVTFIASYKNLNTIKETDPELFL